MPIAPAAAPGKIGFLHDPKWIALAAATLGYLLDACDVLLYVFSIQSLKEEFALSNAQAGLISGFTLVASSFGGVAAGLLADRIGRRKTLIYTILLFSLASGGTASATSLSTLLFWRTLVGLGMGGEWSAGAVLVAESWPAQHRAKAMGVMQSGWALGYMLAAALAAVVLPRWGWRTLFLVGVLPALLTVGIRRKVTEPAIWIARKRAVPLISLFRPPLGRLTLAATALTTAVLLGYWGLFTWLPSFLSAPREQGGAGLGLVAGSGWMFAMQIGALAGYLSFGFLADRYGRRPVFIGFMLAIAALTPVYGGAPSWAGSSAGAVLLLLAPLIGFFGSGYFSLFGAMLAELFPTSLRGAGMGFSYNFGRALCAGAPWAVGALADSQGLGRALALNSAFFLLAAALMLALPETRRVELE
ncbi:MAG: MFS transporter [Acidobacteriia bacterium]|nr:MFS transporter [Terriglobia bacterium]